MSVFVCEASMKYVPAILLIAGCTASTGGGPAVSAYSEDSVTLRSLAPVSDPAIPAKAQELCAMNGRTATFIGVSQSAAPDMTATYIIGVPVYPNEFIFACRE